MVRSSGGGVNESGPKGIGGVIHSLTKRPWTAAEDTILMEYVKKHGEGNWNAVQKNSGLMRCGKSCRLRWANHLRPNLKKGSFSPKEEKIIIELHAKLGNKWARMASQLPGRSDNEIKNYWNTRMKRRQRAGLPIYPQEIREKAAAAFHLHNHRPQNNPSSSPSSLLATQKPTDNPSLSMVNSFNFSSASNPLQNHASSFYSNPNSQFQLLFDTNDTSNGFSLPLFSTPYATSSASLLNQNISRQTMPMPSFKFNTDSNFQRDMSFSSMITGASIDNPLDFVSGLQTQLHSSQIPPQQVTPASSGCNDGVCAIGISSNTNINDYQISPKTTSGNSGLLDALVQESQKLYSNEKFIGRSFSDVADKGKSVVDASSPEEEGNEDVESKMVNRGSEANADNQYNERSSSHSSHSSIGMKTSDQEPLEEMNSMDDEFRSLFNNFPLSMPLPGWYPVTSDTSNRPPSTMNRGNADTNQHNGSSSPAATAAASPDLQWSLGSFHWNNMPSIC